MHNIDFQTLTMIFLTVLVFVRRKSIAEKLGPAIQDMLRGGPRPPSHPLPADDSVILNRRRVRSASDV
jgi:hypothetical protein